MVKALALLSVGLMACTPTQNHAGSPHEGGPAIAAASASASASAPADEVEVPRLAGGYDDADAEVEAEFSNYRVEIDDRPGGKRFQGVWLIGEGTRYLISYRAHPWWLPFDHKQVRARGRVYLAEGQAIQATHFRVAELHMLEPGPEDELVSVFDEVKLRGHFSSYEWPKGAKLAGEETTVFVSEKGEPYWLSHAPEPMPELDLELEVKARVVEPSPFVGRPGGPYLWVIDVL